MIKFLEHIFHKTGNNFHLPATGDKVTFSDKSIKENNLSGFAQKHVFTVLCAYGDKEVNAVKLNVGTWLYTDEWKILPKETPLHH